MEIRQFYLITWKEFNDRKLLDKCDVISSEYIAQDIEKFKQMNAQKRLTTTDYHIYNLSEILGNNALKIIEDIK